MIQIRSLWVCSAEQTVEQSLSPCSSKWVIRNPQLTSDPSVMEFSLGVPIFPVILKIYQLLKNNDFLFKNKIKECGPLFSISGQGTSFIWLNARKRIIQSPIRLVCIFFQDDSLSLLATDGLWQLTTLAVMPVYDFICVTLHVTAAFFPFWLQKLVSTSVAPE